MFSKKEPILSQNTDTRTILAEGITIRSDGMSGSGDVKIGGVFFNDIEIDGLLIVQDSGTVKGEIKAKNVIVEGVVEGNINAQQLIHICTTGKVYGDLRCQSLDIDEGASFTGLCEMGEKLKSNVPPPPFPKNETTTARTDANWDLSDKEIKFQ